MSEIKLNQPSPHGYFNCFISHSRIQIQSSQGGNTISKAPSLVPDGRTYAILLSHCRRSFRWQPAEGLFTRMLRERHHNTEELKIAFNLAVSTCERAGQVTWCN